MWVNELLLPYAFSALCQVYQFMSLDVVLLSDLWYLVSAEKIFVVFNFLSYAKACSLAHKDGNIFCWYVWWNTDRSSEHLKALITLHFFHQAF